MLARFLSRTLRLACAPALVLTLGVVGAYAQDDSEKKPPKPEGQPEKATAPMGKKEGERLATDFTLKNSMGEDVVLASFAGKVVVLEWTNPECPYVERHYSAGTMKKLAEQYASKNVVWLAINSSSFATAEEMEAWRKKHELPYPVLLDPTGRVGMAYKAKTTPHVFVLQDGKIVYEGAIDSDEKGKQDSEQPVTNYVAQALDAATSGKPIATPHTRPYGCKVKYAKGDIGT